jgi:hypothetical protein
MLFIWIALLITTTISHAARIALVVGIGEYPINPVANRLPGAVPDARNMKAFLEKNGFRVDMLLNEQATPQNIRRKMRLLSKYGNDPNNTVVFFFAGHGYFIKDRPAQNDEEKALGIRKDEDDGFDEVLVPYTKGQIQDPRNVITDDEIGLFSKNFPHAKLIMIFDSCHSGTSDRSISKEDGFNLRPRMFRPEIRERNIPQVRSNWSLSSNHILLAAAEANERAQDIGTGGLFTTALLNVMKEGGLKLSAELVMQRIKRQINQFTRDYCQRCSQCKNQAYCKNRGLIQNPGLYGSKTLFKQPLFLSVPPPPPPPPPPSICDFKHYMRVRSLNLSPKAKQILHNQFKAWGICLSDEPSHIELSHRDQAIQLTYHGRLFWRYDAKDIEQYLHRSMNAIILVEQWQKMRATDHKTLKIGMQKRVGNDWVASQEVIVGDYIRFIITAGTTSCYPTLIQITNSGEIKVAYPLASQVSRKIPAYSTDIIPQKGVFQIIPPPGIGAVLFLCSADSDNLQDLRTQIHNHQVGLRPPALPSGVQFQSLHYYINLNR